MHSTARNVCPQDCEHLPCAEARQIAATECALCAWPIGFNIPYTETAQGLAHVGCVRNQPVKHYADAPYRDATDIDPYPYGSMKAAPVTP